MVKSHTFLLDHLRYALLYSLFPLRHILLYNLFSWDIVYHTVYFHRLWYVILPIFIGSYTAYFHRISYIIQPISNKMMIFCYHVKKLNKINNRQIRGVHIDFCAWGKTLGFGYIEWAKLKSLLSSEETQFNNKIFNILPGMCENKSQSCGIFQCRPFSVHLWARTNWFYKIFLK